MPHTFRPGDYSVFLGKLQDTFPAWLRERADAQMCLLADENSRLHCLPHFFEKTGLPPNTPVIEIPAGEQHKTLASCELIWQALLDARLDRQALVINLGGGVIGDTGGFCAATWKRGVDFVQVPTTLLSMTDAAIGGKLGIDFQGIKNAVGIFRNPAAVFVDPDFLQTLPGRELLSGFAEVIKHALIGDPVLWQRICATDLEVRRTYAGQDGLGSPSYSGWLEILRASIAVKVKIVQDDPFEKGLRALLNFGHTIGHALESYFMKTDDPLTHGEAIAIGMICETALSGKDAEEIANVIRRHFPNRSIPPAIFPALWDLMQQDKKNAAGKVRMAIPGSEPFRMQLLEPTREEVERSLIFYNGIQGV